MAAPKIFISYAREDFPQAKRLFDAIKKLEEFSPWIDRENLLPGVEWKQAILEAIGGSRFVFILLSNNSVQKTGFVQKEIREALDRFSYFPPGTIFIIPIRIEPCEPKYTVLKSLNWVDLFPEWEEGFRRILSALRGSISSSLNELFEKLQDCRYRTAACRQEWIEKNSDYIKEINSRTVIDYLNERFTVYSEELFAIETMMMISHRNKMDSLAEYVFRSHEVAKSLKYFHEWYPAYGIVLKGASLLSPHVRTMFLRDIFDNNVRFLETRFLSRDTSWGDDLILLEITKHYLVQKVAMYYSPDHIVDRALKVMSWDIPVLELLTFLFWTKKSYREMAFLLPILSRGFMRSGSYSSSTDQRIFLNALEHEFSIDDYYRDEWNEVYDKFSEANKQGYSGTQLPFADYRENYTRLGILLRIGEYMTYSEEKDVAGYGKKLYDVALQKIGELSQTFLKEFP